VRGFSPNTMDIGTQSRIGILGGTFNPVHLGHLILAQSAVETFNLSRLLFIPCAIPPHKRTSALLPAQRRLDMINAAIEGDPRFEVSDIEIERGGISYAVDTVAALTRSYPDSELFFVIGDDTLPELHQWKDIYSLLPMCRFAAFSRGRERGTLRPDDLKLDPPWPERLMADFTAGRRIEISSSDIRYRVAEGLSIRYLVPDAVEMYIAEHGLYRTGA
jgi:nicotinate-nucleotide adenylyltransferase